MCAFLLSGCSVRCSWAGLLGIGAAGPSASCEIRSLGITGGAFWQFLGVGALGQQIHSSFERGGF